MHALEDIFGVLANGNFIIQGEMFTGAGINDVVDAQNVFVDSSPIGVFDGVKVVISGKDTDGGVEVAMGGEKVGLVLGDVFGAGDAEVEASDADVGGGEVEGEAAVGVGDAFGGGDVECLVWFVVDLGGFVGDLFVGAVNGVGDVGGGTAPLGDGDGDVGGGLAVVKELDGESIFVFFHIHVDNAIISFDII